MHQRQYWWVSQGATFEQSLSDNYLWAPQSDKRGRAWFYWDNVSKVKAGDVIFHYADGAVRAVSIATGAGQATGRTLREGSYSGKGWRAHVEVHELAEPITIQHVAPRLQALNLEKGPINRNGGASPGYLYELPNEAVESIVEPMNLNGLPPQLVDLLSEWKVSPAESDTSLAHLADAFREHLASSGLVFSPSLVRRFVAALLAKRFVILAGLSGSGKTRLAQAFARWITPGESSYAIIAVGADWTSNENIVGYPDRLSGGYVKTRALQLMLRAREDSDAPHVLILDEMNLSHVERYFADLLSAMESGEPMTFHTGPALLDGVPPNLSLPPNLFIIGTVNADETTQQFSPKVLDRANVIEFRVGREEMAAFLDRPGVVVDLDALDGRGRAFGPAFADAAGGDSALDETDRVAGQEELTLIFDVLASQHAEFGFRTASEIIRFAGFYKQLDGEDGWLNRALDAQIMQKVLPRLNGARGAVAAGLWALALVCRQDRPMLEEIIRQSRRSEGDDPATAWANAIVMRYPLSAEKIARMWTALAQNGFTSFMEA